MSLNVLVFLVSSQAGVVNIYSQEECLSSASPKPLKSVMNLLTPATSLTFNPSSEILAVASRAEDEAVRLVSVPAAMMSLVLLLTRPSPRCTCPASPSSPTFPSQRRRSFIGPAAWTSPHTAASSHWLTTKATPLCTGEALLSLIGWRLFLLHLTGCFSGCCISKTSEEARAASARTSNKMLTFATSSFSSFLLIDSMFMLAGAGGGASA